MAKEKVNVPEAPQFLPKDGQKTWASSYGDAFTESKESHPDVDDSHHHQYARREANRVLKVKSPESYKDAMDLGDWQVIKREEKDGTLKIVTIDGKKFSFPAPKGKGKDKESTANGGGTPPAA